MADTEQLALLKAGVVSWNEWREGNSEVALNLSDADLRDEDLSEVNLMEANLSGANLAGADLMDARLTRVNLSNAIISGAELSGAYLVESNFEAADLSSAELTETASGARNIGKPGFFLCFQRSLGRLRRDKAPALVA